MDTVWTSLTAPEALGLFRGLVEPLEKLHAPFREFISKELLHGVPLRDDNVEVKFNCYHKSIVSLFFCVSNS